MRFISAVASLGALTLTKLITKLPHCTGYASVTLSLSCQQRKQHPCKQRLTPTNKNLFGLSTLDHYLEHRQQDENARMDTELTEVIWKVATACREISELLRVGRGIDDDVSNKDFNLTINVQGEVQQPMDCIANEIFRTAISDCVESWISEEEESLQPGTAGRKYRLAVDPLDGSSNLDVSLPVGTIFSILRPTAMTPSAKEKCSTSYLCAGRESLVAAGYALYSSCTEFVLATTGEVNCFVLQPDGTFRLSRPNMKCPLRGPYYSLNESREPDWPEGLRRWVSDAKQGKTPAKQKYSSRYVCSLAADVHRTIIRGGWAGNPRPHLRILYEAAPLAFVLEQANGAASNGVEPLMDAVPSHLHDRVSAFLGSRLDVQDLTRYGEVRQGAQQYSA